MKKTTICVASLSTLVFAAAPAFAKDDVTVDDRGITLETGPIKLNIGGRIHVDAAVFDNPATGESRITDADFRRARVELSGQIGESVRFRVDREFAGNTAGWRNVWLQIEPVKNVVIRGGNFTVPFSSEDLQSSNTIPFAERSLASTLAPGFGLGGSLSAHGNRWSASAGYFTDALDSEDGRTAERGDGVAGRLTFLPVKSGGTMLHFGVAGEHRTFNATESIRFSADAGSKLAPTLMASGGIGDLDNLTAWTGEAAVSFGPVLVQGYATGVKIDRVLGSDLNFNGQTVQASWLITGGRYDYSESQGVFNGPRLRKGKGAVELAARYSRLGLTDGTIAGGDGRAITAGANWYLNRNLRVMVDYTDSHVDFPGIVPSIDNKVGVARLQVSF
ncbi:phosphate-selective porin OprO/OprP [Novosphingobium kunmingense]|uniref:Phosphate-selective porin OprO/OprP n=1 Tax=Novosphingobium kunmingense TaxID=1211806 RepID=A0A2N0H7M7_9SPHN|nr:porin [Novosphingobium kunmingense]PKB14941.1 phosphate-selective porin OprO/OprP [Novosphingobium kunmingense]